MLETYEFDDIDEIVEITVEGEVIQSTTGHPFWVIEGDDLDDRPRPEHIVGAHVPETTIPGRWVDSHDLRVGDVLLLKDRPPTRVQAIQVREYSGLVYNFAVEDLACYAVGECRALVHNMCQVVPSGGVPRIGTPRAGTTEVPVDDLIHTHPVPRPGKSIDDTISDLKDGYDVSKPIPVFRMDDGKLILAGGNHRLEAMKQLGEETIPSRIVDWSSSVSDRTKDLYRTEFPDVFGGY